MDKMNDPYLAQPGAQSGIWRKGIGYAWGTLAVLTCPCHVPIYALLLSGTALGAALAENLVVAFAAFAGVFLLSLARAMRRLKDDPGNAPMAPSGEQSKPIRRARWVGEGARHGNDE